jgi:hypothetical protein
MAQGMWLTEYKAWFFDRNLDTYNQVFLLRFLKNPFTNWTWVKDYDKIKNIGSKFSSCFFLGEKGTKLLSSLRGSD